MCAWASTGLLRGWRPQAVRRDPDNWEFHYSQALVLGATGRDPRDSAARALRLNPRLRLTRDAVRAFRSNSRARWKRAARAAPLPFQEPARAAGAGD